MEKPTLVLIPGWAASEALWEYQVNHLADSVRPVVMVMDRESSRDAMVDRVLKNAPQHFSLAGQSMGGWVAQKIAATAPDRVNKLFLLDTWTRPDPQLNKVQRNVIEAINAGHLEDIVIQEMHRLLHPDKLNDTLFLEKIKKIMLGFDPAILAQQIQAMLDDYSSLAYLPKIQSPTLIIHGRQDGLFSLEEPYTLTDGIKNSHLAIIEECGHVCPLEQPQAVTALMRLFLSDRVTKNGW